VTRVLILDDDDGIRTSLALVLAEEGYDVVPCADAETAFAAVTAEPVELMLVDLMLGTIDGFTFIRNIRPFSDAPVIVLSARNDTHDIVRALEAGADDYVTKPFELAEVTARLRALRRRGRSLGSPSETVTVLESGAEPLVLDTNAATVTRNGVPVHLTVTEYRLLCELAGAPHRVFSRQHLLDRVWDRGFFGDDRIVDVHIRRLRTKIEHDPAHPRLVVTARGLGYRLETR